MSAAQLARKAQQVQLAQLERRDLLAPQAQLAQRVQLVRIAQFPARQAQLVPLAQPELTARFRVQLVRQVRPAISAWMAQLGLQVRPEQRGRLAQQAQPGLLVLRERLALVAQQARQDRMVSAITA